MVLWWQTTRVFLVIWGMRLYVRFVLSSIVITSLREEETPSTCVSMFCGITFSHSFPWCRRRAATFECDTQCKSFHLLFHSGSTFITLTSLYCLDPSDPHFYKVKLGLQGYSWYLHFMNSWCFWIGVFLLIWFIKLFRLHINLSW